MSNPHHAQQVKGSRSLGDNSDAHHHHHHNPPEQQSSNSTTTTTGKVTNLNQYVSSNHHHYAQNKGTIHRHNSTSSHNGKKASLTPTTTTTTNNNPITHTRNEHDFSKEINTNTTQHVKTNVSGSPLFIATHAKQNSYQDILKTLLHSGVPEPGRSRPWPYLRYMANGFKNLFLTFWFNWTMILTAPLSSIMLMTVYPASILFLAVFQLALKLLMEKWGGNEVARYISVKHGQGFGVINWGSPELLLSDTSAQLVQITLPTLGSPGTPIPISGNRRRTFDLSVAQTFVLLSSLIYERDSAKVKESHELSKNKVDDPSLSTPNQDKIKQVLWESESRIRSIAEGWGLHFAGVSELKSLGGPYAGIFWSETTPCIILVCKGTTPDNYEEYLVDATFQRTDARSFLYGCVHEGFYESLFSTSGFGANDFRDPYGAIVSSIINKATQIQEHLNTMEPVQLWVTGHSLGAALSSLLFARWLKCPTDLGRNVVLRDAYVIGTPAVGDADFASTFSSFTNLPVNRPSTLWRIVNKSDIFSRLPPGYSKSVGHFLSENDFFNYTHVGHAIHITHDWDKSGNTKPLKSRPSSYQPPMQVIITTAASHQNDYHPLSRNNPDSNSTRSSNSELYANKTFVNTTNKHPQLQQKPLPTLPKWAHIFLDKPWLQRYLLPNPIHTIEKMYPFFLMDHIPSQYFYGLQRARAYYENEEAEIAHCESQFVTESLAMK